MLLAFLHKLLRNRAQTADFSRRAFDFLEQHLICFDAFVDQPGCCIAARRTDTGFDQRVDGTQIVLIDTAGYDIVLRENGFAAEILMIRS